MKLIIILFLITIASATNQLTLSTSTALLVENSVTSTLSLVSTFFVAYSMVYLRLLAKGFANQMIFCLLCCSFINQCITLSTLFIMQTSQMISDNTCFFFASVYQFTDLAQCFWILAIAMHIGLGYFVKNQFIKKHYFLFANIFVWGLSVILSIIPVENYGLKDVWCSNTNPYYEFFTLYLFIGIVGVLIIIIYSAVIVNIFMKNKTMKFRYLFYFDQKNDDMSLYELVMLVRRMAIYPFIYLFVWFIPFIDRVVQLMGYDIVCCYLFIDT